MNVQFSICAQSISIDQLTNRVSIFNVLEQIVVPAFPVIVPELVLFALIQREDEPVDLDFACSMRITANRNLVAQVNGAVRFAVGPTSRLVFNFAGLPVQAPGEIVFDLEIQGAVAHSIAVPVLQVNVATAAAAPIAEPHRQ